MTNTLPRLLSLRYRYVWLLLGCIALLFAMGAHTVTLAAWCALVLLVRYSRSAQRFVHWALLWVVLSGAWLFQFNGMAPLPWPGPLIIAAVTGLFALIPFALDRWWAHRLNATLATLVFPTALAAMDFSLRWNPYGSWGAWGYSQYLNLPLVQILTVTGIPGIAFVLGWFAALVNGMWERSGRLKTMRGIAILFAVVVGGIFLGGSARLLRSRAAVASVPVSGLTANFKWDFPSDQAARQFWSGQALAAADLNVLRKSMLQQSEDLLERTISEARAGARIVVWSESAAWIWRTDEPAFLNRASNVAQEHGIYLAVAFASINPEHSNLHQNKIVLIGPDGRARFEYQKSRPVPGAEQATTETRPNPLFTTDTPAGRVGSLICFDLDFPNLVRQAGQQRTDILLVPAHDWQAIDPLHSRMAAFRAVENGFNLVRTTADGRSVVVDHLGRTLAEVDDFQDGHVIRANVPTHGAHTLYSQIGDTFGWLSLIGLFALGGSATIRKTGARVSA